MNPLKRHAVAAATLLLALASPAFTQVTKYTRDQDPGAALLHRRRSRSASPLANGMVILLQEDHELPLIRGSALIRGGERDVPAAKAGLADDLRPVVAHRRHARRRRAISSTTSSRRAPRASRPAATTTRRASRSTSSRATSTPSSRSSSSCCRSRRSARRRSISRRRRRAPRSRAATTIRGHRSVAARRRSSATAPTRRTRAQPEYATIASSRATTSSRSTTASSHPNNIDPRRRRRLRLGGDGEEAPRRVRLVASAARRAGDAPAAGTPAKPGVYFVAKDDVTQSNIAVVGIRRRCCARIPTTTRSTVMNEILSGGFSGRLMNAHPLASRVSRTASAAASAPAGIIRRCSTSSMGTKSASTVERSACVNQEISDLQRPAVHRRGAEAREGHDPQRVRLHDGLEGEGAQPARCRSSSTATPPTTGRSISRASRAVTAADVERVAKKYVHPDQLAVLVVGNEKDFDKPLSTLGAVTPIDITIPEPGRRNLPRRWPHRRRSRGRSGEQQRRSDGARRRRCRTSSAAKRRSTRCSR